MSRKYQNRIGELIRHTLNTLITRQLNDPRVVGITITDVEVTADTRFARIFYSLIGDEEAREQARIGLASASGWLGRELGARLRTKHTPHLTFKFDISLERGEHMQQLLDRLKEENERPLSAGDEK